jgi:hypothetical protein
MAGSRLIRDLQTVPDIVASLGLSIAAAQQALNVDYLDSLERVIGLAKSLLGDAKLTDEAFRTFIETLIKQLAPSRYQFTETTLAVRLNLSQRFDVSGGIGLGVGAGAVAVNAAFALAYGFDYQAAAECRTVLHAYPADGNVMDKLLGRAKEISDKALTLPEIHPHEQKLIDKTGDIFNSMLGQRPTRELKAASNGGAAARTNNP